MERRLEVSNLIHCVASLQRVAKLAPAHAVRGSPALQLVCERCARCLGGGGGGGGGDQSGDGVSGEEPCEPRHVSGALWASAKLDLASRPAGLALVRAALSRGVRTPAEWFKPMELSMAVWAVGKFGARLCAEPLARDFVWRLVRAIVESGGSGFDSQGFSNVVAGVASVGAPDDDPSVMAGLLACLKKHLGFFNPQEVSNTLHNLAKLNARLDAPGLAEAFACAVSPQRAHFTPQHWLLCQARSAGGVEERDGPVERAVGPTALGGGGQAARDEHGRHAGHVHAAHAVQLLQRRRHSLGARVVVHRHVLDGAGQPNDEVARDRREGALPHRGHVDAHPQHRCRPYHRSHSLQS